MLLKDQSKGQFPSECPGPTKEGFHWKRKSPQSKLQRCHHPCGNFILVKQNVKDSGVNAERGRSCMVFVYRCTGFLLSTPAGSLPSRHPFLFRCSSTRCLLPSALTAPLGPRLSMPLGCLMCRESPAAGSLSAQELGFPSERRSRLLLVMPVGSQERVVMLIFCVIGCPEHLYAPSYCAHTHLPGVGPVGLPGWGSGDD